MFYRDMPQHPIDLGSYIRADGEKFTISGLLYESPPETDFWTVVITAHHEKWNYKVFKASIPKRIASSVLLVTTLTKGAICEQVKSSLLSATGGRQDIMPCFSMDGWVLV